MTAALKPQVRRKKAPEATPPARDSSEGLTPTLIGVTRENPGATSRTGAFSAGWRGDLAPPAVNKSVNKLSV